MYGQLVGTALIVCGRSIDEHQWFGAVIGVQALSTVMRHDLKPSAWTFYVGLILVGYAIGLRVTVWRAFGVELIVVENGRSSLESGSAVLYTQA